ncbi:AAA family ATPase [Sulfobacillus harzensis]|uniref:AAA family ATPase n=1 Tax=Sulfobacillus harzensis TaxID=2729629 RepID=A0A7Y0L2D8_9FIRM|nr:AAA family ATPase [Sulfobacillus harzensis]NMP22034.1 AAA family ATPase [Sulfobacillus harzensis]
MANSKDNELAAEQSVLDAWAQWVEGELVSRRESADRAYKRALQIGDEPAWQHAEIVERSYAQLEEMKSRQDPYFARIQGRMKDVDGVPFEVDLRVHRYHRSEAFPLVTGGEMLDISHLAPLADLVRNPAQKELTLTLRDREFLDLMERGGTNPRIEVVDCTVEDIELEDGRVVRMAPRYGAIFEDRVRKRLGQAATPALDILADVLDQEQNAIIADRDPKMQLLILDGPAGTGKTVVAAHRIAVAADPQSPGLYLTPTTTVRDYVRPVLPRLGLERGRANAWSLADLAAMMWPDFPWDENLLGIVPESPWNQKDWTKALDAAKQRLGNASPERLYREAAGRLGAAASTTFGLRDVAPLLWLGAWSKRPRPTPEPDWIIIDEAQAIPILAYEALREWLGPGVSWILAGDLMQQGTHHDWDGWTLIQEALGISSRRLAHLWLSRSYRVPPKIHAAAERLRLVLNPHAKPSESVPWHLHAGSVTVSSTEDMANMPELVKTRLQAARDAGIVSIALLAPSDQRLGDWEGTMRRWNQEVQVLRGTRAYGGGVVLATLDMVRGLEFDAVLILDVTDAYYPNTSAAARTLYTSMTRARRIVDFLTVSSAARPSSWLSVIVPDMSTP